MIQVIIKEDNRKDIVYIQVKGHANSAEYGKDLVCAGVSTTCVGIANQLANMGFLNKYGSIELEEGYFKVEVHESMHDIQVVLETFETIMKTIELSYPKYIKIMKTEV